MRRWGLSAGGDGGDQRLELIERLLRLVGSLIGVDELEADGALDGLILGLGQELVEIVDHRVAAAGLEDLVGLEDRGDAAGGGVAGQAGEAVDQFQVAVDHL